MSDPNLTHHPTQFFNYPTNRLTCYFETKDRFDAALRTLADAGFDVDDIHVLHGSEGVDILDIDGSRHGTLARISRLMHTVMSDTETHEMELMREHLEQGHIVIAVPAAHDDAREQVRRIMHDNDGHHITFFSRFYIENVEE